MTGVQRYVAGARKKGNLLGRARFLTSTAGVTLAGAAGLDPDSPSFQYKGESTTALRMAQKQSPERIYFMMGLNDMAQTEEEVPEMVEHYELLLDQFAGAMPASELIIMTPPPKIASSWLPDYVRNKDFGNGRIAEFSAAVLDMCNRRGLAFLDVHSLLADENGAMPDEYCSDGYIHLNAAGAKIVTDALYNLAESRGILDENQ